MDYITIFIIAVGSYAIMVALTYVSLKAAMLSEKEVRKITAEKNEDDVVSQTPTHDTGGMLKYRKRNT